MDVLEELESIALLTGGGSEVFKKVGILVDHLMTRIRQLKAERDQSCVLLKTILPILENVTDEGPPGSGWKSEVLERTIGLAEELTQNIK